MKDMDINRRKFLTVGALAAAAGVVGKTAQASGEAPTKVGRRSFVASCPPSSREYGSRRPGPTRLMVIGAHPDDADITCGGLAVKHVEAGSEVVFVSLTNGCMGHHRLSPEETARTRKAETQEAKRRFGLKDYIVLDNNDCALQVTYENRMQVAKLIREFQPDFVITHRTCDYHVDHRACGTLVMDAGYLLGVPHWVPEAPAQRLRPVIFYMHDPFTVPREIRPDAMVDVGPYLDKWCDGLDAQQSQFYDWLPWDKGAEAEVAAIGDRSKNIAGRNAYLRKYWAAKKAYDAKRVAKDWKEEYPDRPVPQYMENYEVSEYGRAPTEADLRRFVDAQA